MMNTHAKYRIVAFKDFVPDSLRFIVFLLTAIIFQFSNAIYLTNINELVGSKALTMEDVKLLASASFIGMTLVFPILFRVKFRFTSRTILLSCLGMVVVGNVINMYCTNMLILLITSYLVGCFKMIGTFECFSSVQLVITPKRDLTLFFCVIYLIILGSVQLSGVMTAQISYLLDWRYMPITIIALQLLVMLLLSIMLRPIRLMKKMPLYQIDWIGMGLWSLLLLVLNFIFEYGERLDWFHSQYICLAVICAIVVLYATIKRMLNIRRPFILPETFKYRTMIIGSILFIIMQIFMSTSSVIMNTFTGGILHYDILNNVSLNWAVLVGLILGSVSSFYWFIIYKGGYKPIFAIAFLSFVFYHFILYFVFSPSIPKEQLFLPYVLKGFAHILLYISVTAYIKDEVPFEHFFSALTLMGVIRSAVGGTISNSFYLHLFNKLQKKNFMNLSQEIDFVNPVANSVYQNVLHGALMSGKSIEQATSSAYATLYGQVKVQSMLLTWKEMCSIYCVLGIISFLAIILFRYMKPTMKVFPKIKNIWKYTWGKIYLEK